MEASNKLGNDLNFETNESCKLSGSPGNLARTLYPFGVDIKKFSFKKIDRKKFLSEKNVNVADNDLVVCYCGTVGYQKGVHTLVELARNLENKNVKFVILGPILSEFKDEVIKSPKTMSYLGGVKQERLSNFFSVYIINLRLIFLFTFFLT